MDALHIETIGTLRTADLVLRNEVEWRVKARSIDEGNLRRLQEAARSFQMLAHALGVTMLFYPDVPDTLQQEVESLVDTFSDMVDQLETMLAWDLQVN